MGTNKKGPSRRIIPIIFYLVVIITVGTFLPVAAKPDYVGPEIGDKYTYNIILKENGNQFEFAMELNVVEIEEVWAGITVINCSSNYSKDISSIETFELGYFIEEITGKDHQTFIILEDNINITQVFQSNYLFFINQNIEEKRAGGDTEGMEIELRYSNKGVLEKMHIKVEMSQMGQTGTYEINVNLAGAETTISGFPIIIFIGAFLGITMIMLRKQQYTKNKN